LREFARQTIVLIYGMAENYFSVSQRILALSCSSDFVGYTFSKRILPEMEAAVALRGCFAILKTLMSTAKQDVESLLKKLPDNSSVEDIQYHLYVLDKVRRGWRTPEPTAHSPGKKSSLAFVVASRISRRPGADFHASLGMTVVSGVLGLLSSDCYPRFDPCKSA
jgi:hypothetical protein